MLVNRKTALLGLFGSLLLSSSISAPLYAANSVKLATTTSTQNSGLLEFILPDFQNQTGIEVQVIAVGTGKALALGCSGDVDVVLVHAPKAEEKFVADGCGVERFAVMYNDFVLLGPQNDPAQLGSAASVAAALKNIADSQALFVSRGDDSGTHKKELEVWASAGLKPAGDWYREAGQGMGKVIQMAGELQGYSLTDRGTWLSMIDKSPLKVVFEGDDTLLNPYAIIAVSSQKYPDLNGAAAESLIQWIRSVATQKLISDFKINGQSLFVPTVNSQK